MIPYDTETLHNKLLLWENYKTHNTITSWTESYHARWLKATGAQGGWRWRTFWNWTAWNNLTIEQNITRKVSEPPTCTVKKQLAIK